MKDGKITLFPAVFPSYRLLENSPIPRIFNAGAGKMLLIAGAGVDAEKDLDALQWEPFTRESSKKHLK